MILGVLLSLLLVLVSYIAYWIHKRQQILKEKNVKHNKPLLLFGNSLQTFLGNRHNSDITDDEYHAFPEEEIVGHYELFNPQYVIRNPDYVERVLIRDFASFHDRITTDGKIECAADANLFLLPGNTWRAVRQRFSPLFTSGKLKYMYHTIADCGKTLVNVLDKQDGKEVEMSDTMGLFAMDVIGSTTFGIEPTLLENPDSKFREMGKKVFENSLGLTLRFLTLVMLPRVARLLNIRSFTTTAVLDYFCEIISKAIEFRKKEGFVRNDFVQMLIHLKEKGKIEMQLHEPGDEYLLMDNTQEIFELQLTDDILVGGAFTFLTAGFHATAMTLTYTIFELSQNPQVTLRLRQEIKECIKGDVPTFDELKDMAYLEKVIKESLRMHPTATSINRTCNKEYTFPNGLTMSVGEAVLIPVQSLHMDPKYWSEPEVFDPERFNPDCTFTPGTYLPFGAGPRICIAMRFAMLELKFAVVTLLKNYNFELSKETKLPLKLKPRIFLATPDGGITFRVTKISS